MSIEQYLGRKDGMSTRRTRQKTMSEDIGVIPLTLVGIQEPFSKEFQKMAVEMKSFKQEIITAVETVETKIDKRMTALEEQIGEIHKSMVQLSTRVQLMEDKNDK